MENTIILEAKNISKQYPGTLALSDVDFKVRQGKVNVLIGENGAGKSTLMKIIAGVERASNGNIFIDGTEVVYNSPADALKAGVGIIFQELNLFPNLNIAENIFMTREQKKNPVQIDHKKQIGKSTELLEKLQLHINPTTLVKDLRVGQQQIVEIAKVLSQNAKIIIMDEPTSALSQEEVSVLFNIIEELKIQGVSIIYISHRLEEIIKIGDYITILRDGKKVAEDEVKNIDIPWIISAMTGGNTIHPIESKREIGDVLLEVNNLNLFRDDGKQILKDISFALKKGEILGLYGLRGAGRTELLECLIGSQERVSGEIILDNKRIKTKTIHDRIKDGFALIPEDRKHQGIFENMSILENMTIANLDSFSKYTLLQNQNEISAVDSMVDGLRIKIATRNALIRSLSGGNQQKVVIGKSLLTDLKVLLMDEPTRGIDIGAKRDVFNICEMLAQKGLGIIFVSSEMQEMLAIPDRILVLSEGKLKGEFSRSNVTEADLVRASAIDLNS